MNLLKKALHVTTTKLGFITNKVSKVRGRINIENIHQLASSKFVSGSRYDVITVNAYELKFIINESGKYVVAQKENKRRDGKNVIGSRVDCRLKELGEHFANPDDLVVYYLEGMLVVTDKPSAINNQKRIEKLKKAIADNEITSAAIYSGIGTLDDSLHEGFAKQGLNTSLVYANDVWDKSLTALYENNLAATNKTKTYSIGIEELCASGDVPFKNVVLLTAGIVCKGASKLNVKTRDLPEMHPISGHQVMNFCMLLQAMKWDIPLILIENVLAWEQTVSCDMLKRVFDEQGYEVALLGDYQEGQYKGLNSCDYGDLEQRVRMGMLAYPKGICLDFSLLEKLKTGYSVKSVRDIRLPEHIIPAGEYDKGANLDSDNKKAKGWKNRIVSDSDVKTASLSAGCWKQRVEDPKFKHPTIAGKSRLPMPEEHSALKGQPLRLINSLPFNSNAHTALGNGATRKVWSAVGITIAGALRQWHSQITKQSTLKTDNFQFSF
jgi:DNA (cytosine-5)-methyltransferase 1